MWLVVGLGNPGPKYARNRHNIGFRVVEEVARRYGIDPWRSKYGGEVTSGQVKHHKAVLLKPMEFMNVSGNAVQRAAHFHTVEPERILVVHDEIDFPLGRVKVKADGGHGGHNGLRSIIKHLGSNAFPRVRVGVDRPTREDGTPADDNRVAGYVLSDFPAGDARDVDDIIDRGANAVEAVVSLGVTSAMNEVNRPHA